MILIRDVSRELVEACFDQPTKDILETTINGRKVTVESQLLHHHKLACYEGTKEDLISSFLYKLHLNEDLLIRIKNLQENIRKIVELSEYSRVNVSFREQLGTETTIGATASESRSSNTQADTYSGVDQTKNINIDDDRLASSQTNVVEPLNIAIPPATISKETSPDGAKRYSIVNETLTESDRPVDEYVLNNPQRDEDPIGYQNYQKNLTTNQSNNTNVTESSRGATNTGKINTGSSSTNTKGTKSDELQRDVEFQTNDARLKLWKSQIPKLKLKFWNSFHSLFIYEQY